MLKCPGLDKLHWKPEDIFNVPCPACQKPVEFFKTDSVRKCPSCHCSVRNPRLDLGCAAWCPHAELCFGGHTPEPGSWRKPRPGMPDSYIK